MVSVSSPPSRSSFDASPAQASVNLKMSSPLFADLREGTIRAFGLDEGLVDNKVCAVDADWSGLRFVIRREDRPSPPARRR